MAEKDWCNDEIWVIVWKEPLSDELREKLLYYSQLISDDYLNMDKFSKEVADFEELLKNELSKGKD